MRKLYCLLLIIVVLFISSCGGAPVTNGAHPSIDGTTFNYFTSFSYENIEYQISFPINNNESSFYLYEETKYKTTMKTWVINYYYDSEYYYDEYFNENEEVLVSLYEALLANKSEIDTLIGFEIDLHHPIIESEEEVALNNIFEDEIVCVFVDKYLPIRLKNSYKNYSYTISIPIKRLYLAKSNNMIESPINGEIISWEDFLAIPNMSENTY